MNKKNEWYMYVIPQLAKVGTSLKETLEKLEESKNELKTNENG